MNAVIWSGAVITLLGLAALVWCIRLALAARKLTAEARAAMLHKVLIWNMAGFGVAAIGLMVVVVAVILNQ